MGRASDNERLVRCAAAARLAARGLEPWEHEQRRLLGTIYEQARDGLADTDMRQRTIRRSSAGDPSGYPANPDISFCS